MGLAAVVWFVAQALASPAETEAGLRVALGARDGSPDCASLAADAPSEEVRDALIELSAAHQMPPWLPMRAARCVALLGEDDPVARAQALAWVSDPAVPGLALVVAGALDRWTPEDALAAGRGLRQRADADPRFARLVGGPLRRSQHPQVAALAQGLGP